MANVIHRTTLEFLRSVNDPNFPEPVWKHNPNMSAVEGVPQIYWKAPADWDAAGAGPVEMTTPEKAGVDAAILAAARDGAAAMFDNVEDALRAFMLAVLDEFNAHAAHNNALLSAVAGATNLATFQAACAAIGDYPERTATQLRNAVRNKLGS